MQSRYLRALFLCVQCLRNLTLFVSTLLQLYSSLGVMGAFMLVLAVISVVFCASMQLAVSVVCFFSRLTALASLLYFTPYHENDLIVAGIVAQVSSVRSGALCTGGGGAGKRFHRRLGR